MFLIIFLYALLASTFTIGKAALFYFKPLFFIGVRMIPSGIFLLGYLYFFKRDKLVLHWRDSVLFAQLILFHIYAAFVLEFWSLQYLTSSKACLLYNTSPFITALFAYLFFHEKLSIKKGLGLIIGFLGFIPILLAKGPEETSVASSGIFSTAEIVLLVSVVASSYGWILMKKIVKDRGYSPFMANGVAMIGGGILALITSAFFEPQPIIVPSAGAIFTGLSYTFLMIIIANIIFYNLYSYLLHFYSATWLSFVGLVTPIFAALYGSLFLKETIGLAYFFSISIVFCGLYLFYQDELNQKREASV